MMRKTEALARLKFISFLFNKLEIIMAGYWLNNIHGMDFAN